MTCLRKLWLEVLLSLLEVLLSFWGILGRNTIGRGAVSKGCKTGLQCQVSDASCQERKTLSICRGLFTAFFAFLKGKPDLSAALPCQLGPNPAQLGTWCQGRRRLPHLCLAQINIRKRASDPWRSPPCLNCRKKRPQESNIRDHTLYNLG